MLDPAHPLLQLLQRDKRYPLAAYRFIFEALEYAQKTLKFGTEAPSEPLPAAAESVGDDDEDAEEASKPQRHVSGQELCEAIRRYALDQYGYMAQCVLGTWGIRRTGDFGEIVFNLIGIGQMRKSPRDRREDFESVFDFDEGLSAAFRITAPD